MPFDAVPGARGGPWAHAVLECSECHQRWECRYDGRELCFYDLVNVPDPVLPLLRTDTETETIWGMRASTDPIVQRYLLRFLQLGPVDPEPLLERFVSVLHGNDLGKDEWRTLAAQLSALLGNGELIYASADLRPLRLALGEHPLRRSEPELDALFRELQKKLELLALRRLRQAQEERRGPGNPPVKPLPFKAPWFGHPSFPQLPAEGEPAPPPTRPSLIQVLPLALRLTARGYGEFLAAITSTFALCELVLASDLMPEVSLLGLTPILAAQYAAAASACSERWPKRGFVLGLERMPSYLFLWAQYTLAGVLFLVSYFGGALLLPSAVLPAHFEEALWWTLVAAVLIWSWPRLAVPYVYKGVPKNSRFLYQGYTWFGPGGRTARQIRQQPGFFLRATLPLAACVGTALAVTSLVAGHFAFLARLLVYAVLGPIFAVLCDVLVEGWRIHTGDGRYDR